ncbi:phage holin family protein [Planctomonas sp. JC2975]|uniref:phage holin family protein n=1 Tax=Planctomonas sp. JC2975 TaxID=2729626 RepID=UPI00147271E9|nr:phage holin family protein [Planctomonas sp. JC2975]NNC12479.1 phage holin family protein [Planctomonas sp. JC2975]
MRFLLKLIINAFALWVTTLIVSGVTVESYDPNGGELPLILTYLLIALIFGVVNGIVGTVIRIVAFPLYILTLGLISLIVNGLLLLIVSWISDAMGFGLHVDGFWDGVWAALILAVISWLLGLIFRPVIRR